MVKLYDFLRYWLYMQEKVLFTYIINPILETHRQITCTQRHDKENHLL